MSDTIKSLVAALFCASMLGAMSCAATSPSQQPDTAADASAAAPTAAAKSDADPDKTAAATDEPPVTGDTVVCKRTRSTGSNFARRKCQTVDEWEAESRQGREALDRLDRKNKEGCAIGQLCGG